MRPPPDAKWVRLRSGGWSGGRPAIHSSSTAGVMNVCVTRSRSMISPISPFGNTIALPARRWRRTRICAAARFSETQHRKRSPGPTPISSPCRLASFSACACVRTTPFGGPVVPEESNIDHGRSPPARPGCRAGGGPPPRVHEGSARINAHPSTACAFRSAMMAATPKWSTMALRFDALSLREIVIDTAPSRASASRMATCAGTNPSEIPTTSPGAMPCAARTEPTRAAAASSPANVVIRSPRMTAGA